MIWTTSKGISFNIVKILITQFYLKKKKQKTTTTTTTTTKVPIIIFPVITIKVSNYWGPSKAMFLRESFNLWRPLLMIAHYHQTKTPISFWCRRGIEPQISYTTIRDFTNWANWNPHYPIISGCIHYLLFFIKHNQPFVDWQDCPNLSMILLLLFINQI